MGREGRHLQRYALEFKRDAVALVRASSSSLNIIARDLGVNPETLRGWVKQDKTDRGEGPPGALTTEERQELTRLRRENVQLRMEREILKNAAAFFIKETTR